MAKPAPLPSRTKELTGYRKEQSVVENAIATAERQITFPGIQQCISITGYRNSGLLGAHITPGATRQELSEQLAILAARGIKFSSAIYAVGNFDQHFSTSTAIITDPAVLISEMAKAFKTNGPFWLCNTSPLAAKHSWGIDIIAKWTPVGASFLWRGSMGAAKKLAPEHIDEPFNKYFGSQS